jgi:hypothetical protein
MYQVDLVSPIPRNLKKLIGIKEFTGEKAQFQDMFEDFVFRRLRYMFSF